MFLCLSLSLSLSLCLLLFETREAGSSAAELTHLVAQRHDPRALPPHAYQVACTAYEQMLSNKQNQSMIISGESGAGKTEATKICLSFLAEIAGYAAHCRRHPLCCATIV